MAEMACGHTGALSLGRDLTSKPILLFLSTMLNTDALGFLQLQLETLVLSYRPVTPRGHFQHRLFFECHLALREQRQVFVEVGKATLMIAHQ